MCKGNFTIDGFIETAFILASNLACSTLENNWTACKNKSSFINCEAEFSATISLKLACVRLGREYANYFKF